jgi:hypothetical protein
MRKLLLAVTLGVVAALSVAGIAAAVNTYEVHLGKATPEKPGSAAKPLPVSVDFGFRVDDTEDLRPSVIKQYRIGGEGLKFFPKARPACTFAQADESPDINPACRKAIVGSGSGENEFGPANDRNAKGACDIKITLINLSNGPGITKKRGGMAIRIDADPPACPLPLHRSIAAPFYDVKIGGVAASELRFTVPDNLVHPAPGVDNSIIESVTKVAKKTGKVKVKGKTRTVGFYSSIGRKGKKRTTRVTFVDESGRAVQATAEFPK